MNDILKEPKDYAQHLLNIASGNKEVAKYFVICAARDYPQLTATFLVAVMTELFKD